MAPGLVEKALMNIAVIVLLAAIVLVALVCCIVAVRRRRRVTAVVVAMLALVVVAMAVLETVKPRNAPAMKGGFFLKAAPGIRLYVGERLVGRGIESACSLPLHSASASIAVSVSANIVR